MRLLISDTDSKTEGLTETIRISPSALGRTATHLFIASTRWDSIHVDIVQEIPRHVLNKVQTRSQNITCSIRTRVTEHSVGLLIDLFPSLEGKIRKSFFAGGDLNGVVPTAEIRE
jgi:hypothetical protein